MAAARAARTFTGKKYVIKNGGAYHGWSDQFVFGMRVPGVGPLDAHGIPAGAYQFTQEVFPNDLEALQKRMEENELLAFSRIECHYTVNDLFFPEDNYLLNHIHLITHLPLWIAQGRYDVICPVISAYQLHQHMPKSILEIVPDAGHSISEPGLPTTRTTREPRLPRIPPEPLPAELGDSDDPRPWLDAYDAGVGSPLELRLRERLPEVAPVRAVGDAEAVPLARWLERLTLALQARAGCQVSFARTVVWRVWDNFVWVLIPTLLGGYLVARSLRDRNLRLQRQADELQKLTGQLAVANRQLTEHNRKLAELGEMKAAFGDRRRSEYGRAASAVVFALRSAVYRSTSAGRGLPDGAGI